MNPGPSIPGRKLPNARPRFFWITLALGLGAARPGRAQPTDSLGPAPPAAEEWRVVERGQDFAVFQHFRARAQADGSLGWQPGGRFTLLENGLLCVDGDYDGPTADRSAVQWLQLQAGAGGLTYAAHGRIYDSAASNPYWYYFPSLNVRCAGCGCTAGDIAVGFSGSRATDYIGAFWVGRKANGQTTRPTLLQAGRASWTSDRWGDYSATCMDPGDDSFWTVQEFSSRAYEDDGNPYKIWATWIGQIRVLP
jgi:hypothetical protein